MRKKSLHFILAGILAFGFFACNKKEVAAPIPAPEKPRLIAKLTIGANPSIFFTYNNLDRVTQVGNNSFTQAFSFANNKMTGHYTQNNFMYWEFYDSKLDAKGRLLEYDANYREPGLPMVYHIRYQFTYNSDGYVAKQVRTNVTSGSTTEEEFNYVNGNLVSTYYSANGQLLNHEEFTYYENIPNKLSMDILKTITGFYTDELLGNHSRNLLKTRINYDAQNIATTNWLYNWDLDAKGYPTKYKTTNMMNNIVTETIIEYKN